MINHISEIEAFYVIVATLVLMVVPFLIASQNDEDNKNLNHNKNQEEENTGDIIETYNSEATSSEFEEKLFFNSSNEGTLTSEFFEDITSSFNDSQDESESDVSNETSEKMNTVLYKSFSLLTKKQLLDITGSKYKYETKEILIAIAINKVIFRSLQNFEKLPVMVKKFLMVNKEEMLNETLESYGFMNNDNDF